MSHPSKAKGSTFESHCRDFFMAFFGWRIERMPAGSSIDRGDLVGLPDVAVECKNAARLELAAWVDETVREARNANCRWPLLVVKRRGKGSAGDAYAVMKLSDWADLYREAVRWLGHTIRCRNCGHVMKIEDAA